MLTTYSRIVELHVHVDIHLTSSMSQSLGMCVNFDGGGMLPQEKKLDFGSSVSGFWVTAVLHAHE